MKIQELAIIFIIIILPISLILSVYTQFQIQTLNIQTIYDTKLTAATYDAIKAFQLNTANSTMSNLANSKIRDLEASISTFKTSIASAFSLSGISEEEMNEYIPALVYTMYDGFYVYSPYTNKNDLGINNDGEVVHGLKPYVTYSCNYKYNGNDIIITYSLDNYITIKGMINGQYIADEGYLIDGIEENTSNGIITYNGVKISAEKNLTENVAGVEYPYRKINGTKYYYDAGGAGTHDDTIFYLSNGSKVIQGNLKGPEALQYYHSVIKNNTSALQYYKNAMQFTQRAKGYGLDNITYSMAYDVTGNQIWKDNTTKVFDFNNGIKGPEENIECELSNFTYHKLAIIKYVIENNLSEVIANYNEYSATMGIDFQIPKLTEEEWDSVIKNISLISFVQGVPIGGKIYNGYTIVNNTESKEVVKEDDIYIIGNDSYYHKIGDQYINDESNIKGDIPAGRLKLDFKRATLLNKDKENIYYYPREEFASYDSVVMQNSSKIDTYDDIYKYVSENAGGKLDASLQEEFYLAVGRERKGVFKFSNPSSYVYDVLVVGYGSSGTSEGTIKNVEKIAKQLNEHDQMNATYIYSTDGNFLTNYMLTQKENYQLIIVDSFVWSYPNKSALEEIQKHTHLMTIGNDEYGLSILKSSETVGTSTEIPQITDFGVKKVNETILSRADSSRRVINFNSEVKVLYKNQYTGAINGTYDAIGYWKKGNYRWIHSQIGLGTSPEDYEVIEKLALLALNGESIYTLTFDANGGSVDTTSMKVYYGEEMELPVPTKDGYKFVGWKDSEGNVYHKEEIYKVDSDDKLTAIWTEVMTITLNAKGGNVNPKEIREAIGTIIPSLPKPDKENSQFMYWEGEDGKKYYEGTEYTITDAETLVARWKHIITLNPNGGKLPISTVIKDNKGNILPKATTGDTRPTKVGPVAEGTTIILPAATRDNYIFDGWINENGEIFEAGSGYAVDEVETLEALWVMQIDNIDWEQDVDSSIGSLKLENNGKTVTMYGNRRNPGKNAIWTDTEADIRSIEFDYNINFGDSFNAAGILLSIEQLDDGSLTGYMLSFNNYNWGSSKGTIWKFEYDMNNYSNMKKTKVQDLQINTSGRLKIDMSEGKIQITGGGLTNPAIIIDDNINRKTFGFFSDHYSHNCNQIGEFFLQNIKVIC